ncbi:hypothetical protein GQ457_03G012870 [Hibiscus cannabinus]
MVSESPVVRVAADSSSSSAVKDSKPFTNKSISIRLDETNYLLWRQQVLFTIESLDLSSHIEGTSVMPPQYLLVNGEKVPNPLFSSFKQQDSALCSWLLASISLSILPSLVSCRTAFEIWEKIQQVFYVSSTTKIMHLHCSLKNLRKRDQGMREYLAQIQSVCDSLAACGNPLSETMHISAILSGLPSEYEPVVAVITSSQQPYKLDGVCGVLLDTEARLQETHSANLVQNSNLGYDGYQFGSSGGSNVFLDQSYYPFVGQVSSGSSIPQKPFSDSRSYTQSPSYSQTQNPPFSQKVYQTPYQNPNFFRGAGFQSGRSYSRGGRGRFFSGRSRPQCQLCGRIGHLINRCYYRFDQTYDGYSINLVEEVADCPKAEGDSFHQEGAAMFATEDFSPVVCEDAAWFPDSGATAHLTPDLGKFITSSPYTGSGKITVANGMAVPISHIGRSSLATNSRSLFLSNLLHVPCVNKNLLSVSRFTKDNNVSVEFFPNSCVVKDLGTQQVMLRGLESNGLYKFFSKQGAADQLILGSCESCQDDVSCDKHSSAISKTVANVFSVAKPVVSDIELWHRRLGHHSYDTLCKSLSMYSFSSDNKNSEMSCVACRLGKSHKMSFVQSSHEYTAPLQLVQVDLWGPTPLLSNNSYYYISFVDAYSRCFPLTRPYNKHKLEYRSKPCVFLGYCSSQHGYKCLSEDGRLYISRHVQFDEAVFPYQDLADKSVVSSLVENFRFPKLSLVSKSVQERADYSSTSHIPPPLSSEFKFPARLLVYQRRPKVLLSGQPTLSSSTSNPQPELLSSQQNGSLFLASHSPSATNQQPELLSSQQTGSLFLASQQPQSDTGQENDDSFVHHKIFSSDLSTGSNFPVGYSQVSAMSVGLDDTNDQLSNRQECSVRESSNTQEVSNTREVSIEVSKDISEVSQRSASSTGFNVKVGCHPMLTRSKTGSLKSKVCFSAVASMEVAEPKTVQQALASKELRERLKVFSTDELKLAEGQVLCCEDEDIDLY